MAKLTIVTEVTDNVDSGDIVAILQECTNRGDVCEAYIEYDPGERRDLLPMLDSVIPFTFTDPEFGV